MDVKPTRSTLPHYPYLDALRGIAVLGVILIHARLESGYTGSLSWITNSGQRGVQLFYVVSAFTIFLSLDSRFRNEKRPIRNFFIRRFFRIAPLFYLMTIINFTFQNLRHQPNEHGPETFLETLSALTFTHGLSPGTIGHGAIYGWSVGVEWLFYLLAPWLFVRITSLQRALVLLLGASAFFPAVTFVASQTLRSPFWTNNPIWPEYLWFLSPEIEMPVFCLGIVTYFLWKERERLAPVGDKTASLILLAVAVEIYISSLPNNNNTLYLSSLAFVPLLLALALHSWPLIVNRLTTGMGKISYSVYLLHIVPLFAAKHFLLTKAPSLAGTVKGVIIVYFITLTLVTLLAWFSYRFIEKPGILLGKRLILYLESEKRPA